MSAESEATIAACLEEGNLWNWLMQMATLGQVGATGVNRQAFSEEDAAARRLLHRWGTGLGLRARQDELGNLFLRYEGTDSGLAPILVGSHLDSQPSGGRFDGVYGVIAALETLRTLRRLAIRPPRSIEAVAWSNEEGSRFAPGAMGSQFFSGALHLRDLANTRDASGVALAAALQSTLQSLPEVPVTADTCAPAAYLEAHIEQGPVLEKLGVPVGVVTGIQGCRWVEFEIEGARAHAGTTPEEYRRDALQAALSLVQSLRRRCLRIAPDCRFTVGRMHVLPNSPNTIPGRVTFTVDLRHPEPGVFSVLGQALHDARVPAPFGLIIRELFHHAPLPFPVAIRSVLESVAASLALTAPLLVSGAFHDALFVARRCPVGMLFVRCREGISHSPHEYADRDDLAAGARLLAVTAYRLALE